MWKKLRPLGLITAALATTVACVGTVTAEATAPDAEAANRHYQAEDWPAVAEAYAAITHVEPGNARAWYRLGIAYRYLGEFKLAAESLDQAQAAGSPAATIAFEKAKIHARLGERDAGLQSLQTAADNGLTNFKALANAPDFKPWQGSEAFEAILEAVTGNAFPCRTDDAFHQFDFWIGDWEVRIADGTVAGENQISPGQGGCMLIEEWTGRSGISGTSLNYYNRTTGQWRQVWVGAGGSLIDIAGGWEDGAMRLLGTIWYVQSGNSSPFRGTWTPLDEGRVRQFFETADADGETWQTWFEGFYSRKVEVD